MFMKCEMVHALEIYIHEARKLIPFTYSMNVTRIVMNFEMN